METDPFFHISQSFKTCPKSSKNQPKKNKKKKKKKKKGNFSKSAASTIMDAPPVVVVMNALQVFEINKRQRTTIDATQSWRLEAAFQEDPFPNKKVKEGLMNELKIPYRTVEVWFQNRRSRNRRRTSGSQRRRSSKSKAQQEQEQEHEEQQLHGDQDRDADKVRENQSDDGDQYHDDEDDDEPAEQDEENEEDAASSLSSHNGGQFDYSIDAQGSLGGTLHVSSSGTATLYKHGFGGGEMDGNADEASSRGSFPIHGQATSLQMHTQQHQFSGQAQRSSTQNTAGAANGDSDLIVVTFDFLRRRIIKLDSYHIRF